MEQYKEKLKIQNLAMGICFLAMIGFSVLAFGSEMEWFSVLKPIAGDNHWHSTWYGFCTGGSNAMAAVMLVRLIRNIRALKDEKKLKKLYVQENDERTLQIQTLAGNTATQILWLVGLAATVIAGYFSVTVSITILVCVIISISTTLLLMGYYSKKL